LFGGSLVQPLQWNPGRRELFSQDGAGRVFHNGLAGAPDGSYVVFDPPFLWMDSELTPGHEWETTFDVIEYNADGVEVWRGWQRLACRVIGFGPVEVPAGTFQAAEVLITREASSLPTYTFRNMYAEGVGYIRRTDASGNVLFELESYGGAPTPTEAVTWGAIKALYRK
jgi:hypothetical protein